MVPKLALAFVAGIATQRFVTFMVTRYFEMITDEQTVKGYGK